MSNLQKQVIEFHRLMDQPILPTPQIPEEPRIRLRAALIAEEFFEVLEAMFGQRGELAIAKSLVGDVVDKKTPRVDLAKLADGFADLDYVVEGSRLEFGIEGEGIAALVHAANVAKVSGEVRADGKRLKPPQWTPPDVENELQRQRAGEVVNLGGLLAK